MAFNYFSRAAEGSSSSHRFAGDEATRTSDVRGPVARPGHTGGDATRQGPDTKHNISVKGGRSLACLSPADEGQGHQFVSAPHPNLTSERRDARQKGPSLPRAYASPGHDSAFLPAD
ncbi:hypothetical protein AAFF_G00304760 [Aldrovandia affinis]|uniref:Uncharacterized protein n=1 Tax=Aldrovandia affinis TaxID=143900 RepID=A0AAD7WRE3_9TELE|nr:hypothetical protein AAFF_G00304760 [Aldrovandia affinis]